ncbi:hypothetical protein [Neptunicella sp.]|uniref:hypothetical protein n=1 Tax=Neptunicella sp. TaxID=2125986 RepID=UPI003F694830
MKKSVLRIGLFCGLFTYVSFGVFAEGQSNSNEIRLATLGAGVGNFAPVLYVENDQVMGTMPEQIRCAFAALGIVTRFISAPIGRHVWAVENDQADGYFPASPYEDDTSPEQTSIVLLESEIAIFSLKPVDVYSRPAPLVAAVRLAMGPEKFIERHQLPVVKTSSFNQAIELLIKKRADAVIANDKGFELAAKNGNYQFDWHKQPLESVKLRLFLSPGYVQKHPDIFNRLNPELEQCRTE